MLFHDEKGASWTLPEGYCGIGADTDGKIFGVFDKKDSFDSSRPHTWPVIGMLFRNDVMASRIVNDFYERRQELTRKKGSNELMKSEESELKAMNRRADYISKERKRAKLIREDADISVKERNDELEKIAKSIQAHERAHMEIIMPPLERGVAPSTIPPIPQGFGEYCFMLRHIS